MIGAVSLPTSEMSMEKKCRNASHVITPNPDNDITMEVKIFNPSVIFVNLWYSCKYPKHYGLVFWCFL